MRTTFAFAGLAAFALAHEGHHELGNDWFRGDNGYFGHGMDHGYTDPNTSWNYDYGYFGHGMDHGYTDPNTSWNYDHGYTGHGHDHGLYSPTPEILNEEIASFEGDADFVAGFLYGMVGNNHLDEIK